LNDQLDIQRQGILFVITAPSGAGKSTICKNLIANDENLSFSVSYTSRKARQGEKDGVHYHFISREEFEKKRENGDFIEWARYADNYYGTSRQTTSEALHRGNDLLLDIEVQGAEQIKGKLGESAVLIFILPPSQDELTKRLQGRGTNTREELIKRLATARNEIKHCDRFQYIVINDDLDRATGAIRSIIEAERHCTSRIKGSISKVLRSFQ
jgi:guanylate kinase